MARMAYTGPQALPAAAAAVIELALASLKAETDESWSIEREPMGSGWHDSSWMLKKGLDVVEGLAPEATPPEWQWRWWIDAGVRARVGA
jgi:hypothetical protein